MASEKILFLGPGDSPLLTWLRSTGENVVQTAEIISPQFIDGTAATFLISYGYRYILNEQILAKFRHRAINLHISYLPWNRGAHPNIWSFMENTPKGVTIHHLDAGIDTGDIIAQQTLIFDDENETLATSYAKLQSTIQALFKQNWPSIKNGTARRFKQTGTGSFHRVKDIELITEQFVDGWNTSTALLQSSQKTKS